MKRGADLLDPESVKEIIATQEWATSTKQLASCCYTIFLKSFKMNWEKPRYKAVDHLPFIPLEREIDDLISACSHRLGTFLQLLKETGVRPGEAWNLKWIDIDLERRTVTIILEKGNNARILPLSAELASKLAELPKKTDYLFRLKPEASLQYWTCNFNARRKSIARKLNNPRLKKISFKTLRHYKGTMEYHKTKDIIHVKKVLGHKHIENTMTYINLEAAILATTADQFTVRVAEAPDEIQHLLEVGFDSVCEKEGLLYFSKRR